MSLETLFPHPLLPIPSELHVLVLATSPWQCRLHLDLLAPYTLSAACDNTIIRVHYSLQKNAYSSCTCEEHLTFELRTLAPLLVIPTSSACIISSNNMCPSCSCEEHLTFELADPSVTAASLQIYEGTEEHSILISTLLLEGIAASPISVTVQVCSVFALSLDCFSRHLHCRAALCSQL